MTDRKRITTFSIYWLPALCYMGVIFFLSSLPSKELKIAEKVSSYFLHMIEYFILYILLIRGLNKGFKRGITKGNYLTAFIVSSLYAVSDEIHQMFVPTRNADIMDVAADVLGALIAVGLVSLIIYRKKNSITGNRLSN